MTSISLINKIDLNTINPIRVPQEKHQLKKMANAGVFDWNDQIQQTVLNTLKSNSFKTNISSLRKITKQLNPSQLHHLIRETLNVSPAELIQEPIAAYENLKKLLTLEQIEAAIHYDYPDFESALQAAKSMTSSAKYYLDLNHPDTTRSKINHILHKLIWSIEAAIDTILSVFGYELFRRDMENVMETNMRLEVVLTIVSAIAACVAIAVTVTGSALTGGLIVGAGIVLIGIVLTLYFKFLKPAPRSIKGCQNLTAQAAAGHIDQMQSRQHYIDQIAATLIASKEKPKVHPLLVGPSGVGKTEIMKGFARCVAEGRYPELKGKQVFYINTADLTTTNMAASIFDAPPSLDKIKDRIRHRREDVILILDEIHQAIKGGKNGNLAERLKTLLDDGEENFPYVVGGTTNEELFQYILQGNADNPDENPIARRFKQIVIEEMSEDQTITILNKMVIKHAGLQVDQKVIQATYNLSRKHFPTRPEPYMASRILAQAIAKANDSSSLALRSQISEQEAKLEKNLSTLSLQADFGLFHNNTSRKDIDEENKIIQSKLSELRDKLNVAKNHANQFKLLINKTEKTKVHLCKLADRISDPKNTQQMKLTNLLKEFALTSYYVNQTNSSALKKQIAETHDKFMQIDTELIQQIIDNELKIDAMKTAMIKKTAAKQKKFHSTKDDKDDEEFRTRRLAGQNNLLKTMSRKKRVRLRF